MKKNFLVLVCSWTLACQLMAAENVVQLPTIVSPTHYRLTLLPILDNTPRLCGHVWIDVTARMETSMMIFHAAADMTVMKTIVMPLTPTTSELKLEYEDGQMVEDLCFNAVVFQDSVANYHNIASAFYQDGQKELFTVTLRENMKRGARYRVGLLYTGSVYDKGSYGFFRVQYEASSYADCCKRYYSALLCK